MKRKSTDLCDAGFPIDAGPCPECGATQDEFCRNAWVGMREPDRARFAAMLIDHGARLDIRDDLLQSTPLGWACRWGRVEIVKLFLARGADPVEADAEPWATPRAWAEKMQRPEIVELLKKRKL